MNPGCRLRDMRLPVEWRSGLPLRYWAGLISPRGYLTNYVVGGLGIRGRVNRIFSVIDRFFLNGDGKIWGASVNLTDCNSHPDHLVAMSILIGSCRRREVEKKKHVTAVECWNIWNNKPTWNIWLRASGTRSKSMRTGGRWTVKPHVTRMIRIVPPWKLVRLGACWLVDQLAPACRLVDQLAPACRLVDQLAPRVSTSGSASSRVSTSGSTSSRVSTSGSTSSRVSTSGSTSSRVSTSGSASSRVSTSGSASSRVSTSGSASSRVSTSGSASSRVSTSGSTSSPLLTSGSTSSRVLTSGSTSSRVLTSGSTSSRVLTSGSPSSRVVD